jgi:hypothetical protein
MPGLLDPARRSRLWAIRRARPEPFAILSRQQTPIPRGPPLKIGNIVGRAIIRLIGAVLLEANDEWQLQHRYMGVEAMGEMLSPASTNETLQLPPKSA